MLQNIHNCLTCFSLNGVKKGGWTVTTRPHPYNYPYVTTASCFSPNPTCDQNGWSNADELCFDELIWTDQSNKYVVIIGNDVWIGEFIGGGTIGDGEVVLSVAVVTKDVPPYAICRWDAGKKYKISVFKIRYRFSFRNQMVEQSSRMVSWSLEDSQQFQ